MEGSKRNKPWVEDVPIRDQKRTYKQLHLPMGEDREGRQRMPYRINIFQAKAIIEFYQNIRDFVMEQGRG